MERIEVLRSSNYWLSRMEGKRVENLVNEEDMDMRRYINMFKKKDFKLWRFFETLDKGLSFTNTEAFFKDGRNIF
jgi:hypothetical protein